MIVEASIRPTEVVGKRITAKETVQYPSVKLIILGASLLPNKTVELSNTILKRSTRKTPFEVPTTPNVSKITKPLRQEGNYINSKAPFAVFVALSLIL